jgi:5-formyltetrahydrofolate cyclo-ligase
MSKAELRRWAKEVRKNLPTGTLSQEVTQHLTGFLQEHRARHILLYSAFGSELDPAALQRLYPAAYYLPRARTHQLEVHPLPCRLVKHRYGFWEPAPETPKVALEVLDAVLVPGLAFDPWGHRLGYGQGFYDRFLAQLPPRTLTVGLVAEALVLPELPHDPWDVPVRFLATEQGVRPARGFAP